MSLLEVKNVKKIYTTRFGSNQVEALRDVNFTVERGEYVAIMGESGSGKTTLLNILAALDKPTEGKVYLKDRDLGKLKEKEIATFRRQNLGFVFQDFNLLDTFSLKDNIFLPLVLSGKKYHGKKNHTNKFKKLYPNWQYERLNDSNVEECFQMALKWRNLNGCEDDEEKNSEMCVTLNSLRLYKELNLIGGLLRVGDEIVAFTIGEAVNDDTFVVHIEKAYADIEGAYTMINQQFVEHEVAGKYKYTNREDDVGEEGLRKAKLSYKPVFMVEKGVVTLKEDSEKECAKDDI